MLVRERLQHWCGHVGLSCCGNKFQLHLQTMKYLSVRNFKDLFHVKKDVKRTQTKENFTFIKLFEDNLVTVLSADYRDVR